MSGHLVCAVEARGHDFADDVHKMFRLLDNIIYFAESGCAPYCRFLYREL